VRPVVKALSKSYWRRSSEVVSCGYSVIPIGLDKCRYYDLLPCNPQTGKASWKEFQSRYATPEELSRWLNANPPAFAFATGRFSGVVTVHLGGEQGVRVRFVDVPAAGVNGIDDLVGHELLGGAR
jgi:hypothetical protein